MIKATAVTYRNAYADLSRSTWLLSLVMLVNRSGTMVVPFMTLYLTSPQMGYSIGKAGFISGLFGLGAFTGAWFGGKLTDKIGYYPVQLITLTGGGILFIILGQVNTFPLICVFTFLVSFVGEAFRPANSTAIAFYSKEENRTRSYALNRLAINLGWALGSSVGGILAKIDYQLLFWVDGFTNIAAALLMFFALKPVKTEVRHVKQVVAAPIRSAFKDKTFMAFLGITVLFASCFFQIFNNLPVFFRGELQLSEPFIGFLMAINGIIIALVEMVLVYKLDGKRNSLVYIMIGVALAGISFWVLNLPFDGVSLGFCMITMITFGEIFSMPFMNSFWIARTQATNRGQYAGLYTMAWSAAQTLGPVGGSQIAEHFGFNTLWWIAGSLSLIASFSFYRLMKKNNP